MENNLMIAEYNRLTVADIDNIASYRIIKDVIGIENVEMYFLYLYTSAVQKIEPLNHSAELVKNSKYSTYFNELVKNKDNYIHNVIGLHGGTALCFFFKNKEDYLLAKLLTLNNKHVYKPL